MILSFLLGNLELHFDSGNRWFTSPANYTFSITSNSQTGGGIQIIISNSSSVDPVRNIRVIIPGFLSNYTYAPFYPAFLSDTFGFSPFRFMDWGATNNMNIAKWSQRPLPLTARENSVSYTVWNILSIVNFLPGSIFQGKYTALVTLQHNHTLVTGNIVDITGSNAAVNYTDNLGNPGWQTLNLAAWQCMIEVLSPNTFLVSYNQVVKYIFTHSFWV